MRFLQPELLWHLLWILPAMLVMALISRRRTARTLKAFLGKHAEDPDYVLVSKGRRTARFILLCGAVFFLIVAAARPSWGVQIQEMSGQGRDLLFVFDVSKSMLAKDVQPSRLAHAKWLVKELVKLNPGDRFGLIAFAGKGFLECPLTSDKTSFNQMLDELNTESIPVGGTNIQEALTAALQAFKAAETQHRAVVLVTDGDELEGDSGKAVDEIIARRIPLFIAGIGDPSQPSIIQVPDGRGGVKTLTDAAGAVVNSPLNEKQLGELARRTGGIYVRSTAGDPGIPALEKRIRALAPQEYESVKTTKPIDRFSYPLAVAFVLSERAVRRSAGAVALFVFAFAGLPLNAQEADALPVPEQTEQTVPAAPENVSAADSFNRGVEAHEKGELQKAAGAYEEALRNGVDQAEIRGRATQNLGVITHTKARAELGESVKAVQGQNLDEAQKKVEAAMKTLDTAEGMYRDSLRENISHEALSRNQSILIADRKKAEELKKKIDELKKLQQQTRQQTQQAKDQQQKENQQNKDSQNQQNKDSQNQQNKDSQNQQNKDSQNLQNKDSQNQQNKDSQSAQQMTDQAKQSAENLQKKAQEMGQQNLAKSAEQAKKELEKAQQEQKNGNSKSAEDHLKNALDALGGDSQKDEKDQKPEKQDQSGKDGKDQKPEKQDQSGKDQQNNDSDIRRPQQGGAEKKPEEGDIDKGQAASILEDMAKDEKDLRDAIKAYRKQRYKNAAPAKDW